MKRKFLNVVFYCIALQSSLLYAEDFRFSVTNVDMWAKENDPRIRSSEATLALTRELIHLEPRFLNERSLTVLYPASGSHITPLDIAHLLIYEDRIDKATFIYTEINNNELQTMKNIFNMLIKKGYYKQEEENLFTEKNFFNQNSGYSGSETTFKVRFMNKPIILIFALNRSGEKYFREEHLSKADIFYEHDSEANLSEHFANILKGFKKPRKELYLIQEDLFGYNFDASQLPLELSNANFGRRYDLLGKVITVPYGYGHKDDRFSGNLDETGDYAVSSAMLLYFDQTILNNFTDKEYEMLVDFIIISGVHELNGNTQVIGNDFMEYSTAQKRFNDIDILLEKIVSKKIQAHSQKEREWLKAVLQFYNKLGYNPYDE